MNTVIIPARGGSKGIYRKNLVPVGGRPLLWWSICQAQAARFVERVIVTTDSDEIADFSRHLTAQVMRRSPETATDTATSESALLEAIEHNCDPEDVVIFLQATSPVRLEGDIDRAVVHFTGTPADSLFSVRELQGYVWYHEAGTLYKRGSTRTPRQQDGSHRFEENGSIYVFRAAGLQVHKDRMHGVVVPMFQHPLCGHQIDEPRDIPIVEAYMRALGWIRQASITQGDEVHRIANRTGRRTARTRMATVA